MRARGAAKNDQHRWHSPQCQRRRPVRAVAGRWGRRLGRPAIERSHRNRSSPDPPPPRSLPRLSRLRANAMLSAVAPPTLTGSLSIGMGRGCRADNIRIGVSRLDGAALDRLQLRSGRGNSCSPRRGRVASSRSMSTGSSLSWWFYSDSGHASLQGTVECKRTCGRVAARAVGTRNHVRPAVPQQTRVIANQGRHNRKR